MAATTIDPEFRRHQQTWIGFTRLIKVVLAAIVVILVGMAIFLL
jgi:Bacterial aa3 type cytochrome c oxidase subunit IV